MSKNRNKILTQFDLSSAFTALSDMDYAAPEKTVKSFQENLVERKGYGKCFEPLFEDLYDLEDTQDLNDAADAREAEVAQAKLSRIEKIIDLDAKSPDELLPSYVGKIIVQCPQCMNLFYKDPTLCNVGEECQHCGNTSGYTLIGKVDAATEADLNQGMDVPADGAPVEEQPVEETPEENVDEQPTEDAGDGDLNLDDLDLNLDEEPAQESFNTNPDGQVLIENVEKLDEECLNKVITDFLSDDSSTHKSLETILSDLYKAHPEAPAENVQSAMDGVLNVEWPLNKIETFGFCAKQHPYVEGLNEEVDKDLDKKLAEHDTYIDYLRKEIATLENSIKNEKNEEIKAAKQAHLDELNQSLDAALPDAVKNGSVEVNTENTEDTSDDNLDADDVLNGKLNNEETTEENAEAESTENSNDESDENSDENTFAMTLDNQEVKESLTESVTIDVDDLDFCQMVNDGKINDVEKYNLGYIRLGELSQICVDNHLDRAYNIIEKAIDKLTGWNEEENTDENSLTEDKRDDDDYYGRDIDDAVIQLKKRGHAEFWCRQGNEKAEEVKKIAKDKYNLDVEYTIDNDYCEAKVVKTKEESLNNSEAQKDAEGATCEAKPEDNSEGTSINWNIDDTSTKAVQKFNPYDDAEGKLNEAVAITISVDEVDDTVTPNANTMVFDNGDAGVAEYHADDNCVNCADPFNQDFEPVEFNRPAFNPFANTEFDFDNETDETAIQNVEPEEMDDKKLDKSDEKELEKELDSEDNSDKKDDKDDKDDEDKGKKAKDESLTESVKLVENKNDKWADTLNAFYKNDIEAGNLYIVFGKNRNLSGIPAGQNQRFIATKDFKQVLTQLAKYSKADRENTLVVLSPKVNFQQFKNAIEKVQAEAQKDQKSTTTQNALAEFNKFMIPANTITAYVNGKQTKEGKVCLDRLYKTIKTAPTFRSDEFGNSEWADTSATTEQPKAEEKPVEEKPVQKAQPEGGVEEKKPVVGSEEQKPVEGASESSEVKENQEESGGSSNENPEVVDSTKKLSRAEVEAKLTAKNFSDREKQRVLSVLRRAELIDEALFNEFNSKLLTEDIDNEEPMSDEDYNRLFDSTTYGSKLGEFYDLSARCGEIFESTYESLGYPIDDEWIIAPEILKDDNKVTELYNAVRKNVVDILNNGSRDELDDGHHGDVIGTLIDLFDINQIFEALNEDLTQQYRDAATRYNKAIDEVSKYKIPYVQVQTNDGKTEQQPDFNAVAEQNREAAKKAYDEYKSASSALRTVQDQWYKQQNESLDEAKGSKEIVDDVTDAEFKELINSDIFNEKCKDEPTEDKKITEDAELDNMLNQLDTEIDNVLNQEEQHQDNSSKEEFEQEMLDEIDEDGLEECLSKSLINIYENVENFKINDINLVNNRLIVEGKIKFNKSNNILDTKYIFNDIYKENDKLILNGYNKTLAEDCNLVLTGNIKDKKFITESFEYNYTVEGDKVHGKVNNN